MKERLFWNREVETRSVTEQQALDTKALKQQLGYVYQNSSLYRNLFGKAGVKPQSFTCLDDLEKFPFPTPIIGFSLNKRIPVSQTQVLSCADSSLVLILLILDGNKVLIKEPKIIITISIPKIFFTDFPYFSMKKKKRYTPIANTAPLEFVKYIPCKSTIIKVEQNILILILVL